MVLLQDASAGGFAVKRHADSLCILPFGVKFGRVICHSNVYRQDVFATR